MKLPPIGVHASIARGLANAITWGNRLGCTAIQIFTHSPRNRALRPIPDGEAEEFRARVRTSRMKVFIHGSYLINLASPETAIRKQSLLLLAAELSRAELLDVPFVVVHAGTASGLETCRAQELAVKTLRKLGDRGTWKSRVLLENTSGARGHIAYRLPDLARLALDGGAVVAGICLDTCHAFAAGYDLRTSQGRTTLLNEAETMGPGSIKLIHVNDSLFGPNSRKDRHTYIGEGRIGSEPIGSLLRTKLLREIPAVMENPRRAESDDGVTLGVLRTLFETGKG